MTDHWDSIIIGNESRPARENRPKTTSGVNSDTVSEEMAAETAGDAKPAKRKPGRPKKKATTTESTAKTPAKRGRPRKTATVTVITTADGEETNPETAMEASSVVGTVPASSEKGRWKKKRGRPRKSESAVEEAAESLFQVLDAGSKNDDAKLASCADSENDEKSGIGDPMDEFLDDTDFEDHDFTSLGWNPPARVVRPRGVLTNPMSTDVVSDALPQVETVKTVAETSSDILPKHSRTNQTDAELPPVWDLSRLDEEDPGCGLSDFPNGDISSLSGDSEDSFDSSMSDSEDDSEMILRAPPHSRAENILSDLFLDPAPTKAAETNDAMRIGAAADDDSSEFEWGSGDSLPIPGAIRSRTATKLPPASRAMSSWGSLAGELEIEPSPESIRSESHRAVHRDSATAPRAGSPPPTRPPERREELRREEIRHEPPRRDERRDHEDRRGERNRGNERRDSERQVSGDMDRKRAAAAPIESDDHDTTPTPPPDRTAPTWLDAIRWLVGRNIDSRDRKGGGQGGSKGGGQSGRRNDRNRDRRDSDRRR